MHYTVCSAYSHKILQQPVWLVMEMPQSALLPGQVCPPAFLLLSSCQVCPPAVLLLPSCSLPAILLLSSCCPPAVLLLSSCCPPGVLLPDQVLPLIVLQPPGSHPQTGLHHWTYRTGQDLTSISTSAPGTSKVSLEL